MTTTAADNTQPIKIVSRIVSAGNSRKVITIPASDLAKVQDLAGKPVLITLQPIL
jgi:hypothetical protein